MGRRRDGPGTPDDNARFRFTPEYAREIRVMRAVLRYSYRAIALLYDSSEDTITRICEGKAYKDIGGPIEPKGARAALPPPRHPSPYTYTLGCRCPGCTIANSDHCKETARKRKKTL